MANSTTTKRLEPAHVHWSAYAVTFTFFVFALVFSAIDPFIHYRFALGEIIYWSGFMICITAIFLYYRNNAKEIYEPIEPALPTDNELIAGLLDQLADTDRQLQIERQQRKTAKPSVKSERAAPGYVYLIAIETGLYKIGLSTNTEGRVAGLSTGLPYELTLLHTIKCRDRFKVEKFFHEKFASKRVKGEWFNLDKDDIEYFKVFTQA